MRGGGAAAETRRRRAARATRLGPSSPTGGEARGGEGLRVGERGRERQGREVSRGRTDGVKGDWRGACESPRLRGPGPAPSDGGRVRRPGGRQERPRLEATCKAPRIPGTRRKVRETDAPRPREAVDVSEGKPGTEAARRGGSGGVRRPERTMGRRSRTWASAGARGAGGWAGGAGSAPRPSALRLREDSPAPTRLEPSAGETGRPAHALGRVRAPQSHAGGRPGRQRLRRWEQLGVLSRNRHPRGFSPQNQETRDSRSQARPFPTKPLRAPPPVLAELLPPQASPEGRGCGTPERSACSPALATITRFVRREKQRSQGPESQQTRTPARSWGSQSPRKFPDALCYPFPLQTPKSIQTEVPGGSARLRAGLGNN